MTLTLRNRIDVAFEAETLQKAEITRVEAAVSEKGDVLRRKMQVFQYTQQLVQTREEYISAAERQLTEEVVKGGGQVLPTLFEIDLSHGYLIEVCIITGDRIGEHATKDSVESLQQFLFTSLLQF